MSNIEPYKHGLPERLSQNLVKHLFTDIDNNDVIQLSIRIDDFDISVKDFSTYLHFIYKIDGILSDVGLLSYSRLYRGHIRIAKIEHGSIEILIERLFSEYGADRLIIIWLALKYLPKILSGSLDAIHKYYDTLVKREEYLEKKERRVIRKNIRGLLNEEVELTNLDKKIKEKLVDILDELYFRNHKKLKATSQFGVDKVKSVAIKKRKNNEKKGN